MKLRKFWLYPASALLAAPLVAQTNGIEEIVVWSKAIERHSGPAVTLTPGDLAGANVVTTEDLVKYEPGLIIRRRFIGDANGTLGLRGANMFQTSRSLVFADGVPLHYLLQTRWDGAPRWSMIAASEIDRIDVLYGPFSAEYGGNSMGGVILMESSIPQRREVHVDTMAFVQDYSAYGFEQALRGYRSFMSYGDRLGSTSVYLSWNHLDNASQPQTYFFATPGRNTGLAASGGIAGSNERGVNGMYFGDSGVIDNVTDSFKLKAGRDFGGWEALLNLAFETRATDADAPNSWIHDTAGNALWSGNVLQDGMDFTLPAARFGVSTGRRDSLSAGLRVKGWLGDAVAVESNLNWFGVLRDETRSSARNPADPAWTPAGQVTDFADTGWRTADVKFDIDLPYVDGLDLATGLRHEDYRLALDVYRSDDYRHGLRSQYSARSGGSTSLDAAFAQLRWDMSAAWELALGARYERWRSMNGYYGADRPETPGFDLVRGPARRSSRLSPKFTLAYFPDDDWTLRYSAARAYRFAIVEELFSQYQAFNAINSANPGLEPENGLHQNLGISRALGAGELQLNLFHERVRDVIEAQATTLPGGLSLRTFLPISEVQTQGVEIVLNRDDVLLPGLNLRFNATYTHSVIERNDTAPELAGKRFPRMPAWRANLLVNYSLTPDIEIGAGLRYASDSFGLLDNSDRVDNVYGAQDAFTFVNLKAAWQATERMKLGFGIDNLFDERAYVTHPWPARTVFFEGSFSL